MQYETSHVTSKLHGRFCLTSSPYSLSTFPARPMQNLLAIGWSKRQSCLRTSKHPLHVFGSAHFLLGRAACRGFSICVLVFCAPNRVSASICAAAAQRSMGRSSRGRRLRGRPAGAKPRAVHKARGPRSQILSVRAPQESTASG